MSSSSLLVKASCLSKALLSKYSHIKKPVAARWNITNSCPNNCKYCTFHKTNKKELTKEEIIKVFEKIKPLRLCRMSISGGEPLLSDNFELIVNNCNGLRISPIVNTSGYNFENQLKALKKVDLIQFSIDGNEKVMEKSRGKNHYKTVMNALELAKKNKLKFSFATTLTKHNIDIKSLSFLLALAKSNNALVAFQPIKDVYNNTSYNDLKPDQNEYKKAIEFLIHKKKTGNKNIRNSMLGLKHVYDWPKYQSLFCTAGKLFFVIHSDGTVVSCDRMNTPVKNKVNILTEDLLKHLAKNSPDCAGCGFCGAMELNFLYDLKFSILTTLLKI